MNQDKLQKWCNTDAEYEEAKKLQAQYDALDPKHEKLPRVVVIDCRERY